MRSVCVIRLRAASASERERDVAPVRPTRTRPPALSHSLKAPKTYLAQSLVLACLLPTSLQFGHHLLFHLRFGRLHATRHFHFDFVLAPLQFLVDALLDQQLDALGRLLLNDLAARCTERSGLLANG